LDLAEEVWSSSKVRRQINKRNRLFLDVFKVLLHGRRGWDISQLCLEKALDVWRSLDGHGLKLHEVEYVLVLKAATFFKDPLVASKVLNVFVEDNLIISDSSRQAVIDWFESERASMSEVEEEESAKRSAWLESGLTSLSLSLGPVVMMEGGSSNLQLKSTRPRPHRR
jgi:hypothetical protein